MQENLMTKLYYKVYASFIKKEVASKPIMKAVKQEYKEIVARAKDIGSKNNLLSSYLLAAFFIAAVRKSTKSPEEIYSYLDKNMKNSRLLKAFLGNKNSYFSEKHMAFRRKWSKETHLKKYENDWVVDVIENEPGCKFGFNYLECGVCKLCKDEKCFELAKYLCKLDFMLVEIIGIKLERTKTLANGDELCDFRFKE